MEGEPREAGDYYTPVEASRILARSDKGLTERRVRQMLQTGEIEGFKDRSGRWHVEQREVHRLLEERRSPDLALGDVETASELVEDLRSLERTLGRLEGRLELSEKAESTIREERDRLLADLEEERSERRRLQSELDDARRSWWRRFFGFR